MQRTICKTESIYGVRGTGRLAVIAFAAMTLVAGGCANDSGSSSGGGDALKIGVVVAESGPIAGSGKSFADGGRIAAKQINDGDLIGGGKTIELVEKEGSEDPAKSASVVAQLAADQSIVGITCCILSTVAGAAKPIAEKQKVPLVLWGATEEGLAEPPYVFRTVTMPQPANEKLATTVASETNIESVAFGIMSDNAGIVSQAKAFQDGMDEAGVESLGVVETLSTQTNFTGAATDLIQKKADAIVVSGTSSNAVALIAALHDKGYEGQVLTGETISGAGIYESQPNALGGVPYPVYFLADDVVNDEAQAFVDDYSAEYGLEPDGFAAQGYNAIYTMAMGMKAAGDDVTRSSLSEALTDMTELENTIYGTVTFEDGQLNASSAVQIVNYTAPDGVIAAWKPGN